MNILLIYESVFNNTAQIATAIADELGTLGDVKVLRPVEVTPAQIEGAELVVVGSPTQKFNSVESINSLINNLPANALKNVSVAAFDTRIDPADVARGLRIMIKLGGFAAARIAQALKKKRGNLIVPPMGFIVAGREGPLKEGEIERAKEWAKCIVEILKNK